MILLDTHTVLWLAEKPESLSLAATTAIRLHRKRDGLAVSDKSLWELAMLLERGKMIVHTSMLAFLQEIEKNFTVLPITSSIAERAVLFSDRYPADPTDRIIGATALVHGLSLITKDKNIRASREVTTVW